MRVYPVDSPQAAARLLAVLLVADSHYSMSELKALNRLEASQQLGLGPDEMKELIDDFCEDLLSAHHGEWSGSSRLDPDTRNTLMAQVQEPALRRKILALCEALALADGHLADGEAAMLDTLASAWRAPSDSQPPQQPTENRKGLE
ncbi:TerB family tellurite resistance protein [Hydrogenophaga sp.]|uniref:TerB family tellurite resistance protein n=1 Tax=Hydrogenophaga sp. TaxID=1904254 RepID=UPI0025BBCC00|nr:TerB family tellurite resistance protein [Hydrogenophaga sp.]